MQEPYYSPPPLGTYNYTLVIDEPPLHQTMFLYRSNMQCCTSLAMPSLSKPIPYPVPLTHFHSAQLRLATIQLVHRWYVSESMERRV